MRAPGVAIFCAIVAGAACGGPPMVGVPSRNTPAGPHQSAYGEDDGVSIDGVAWADMNQRQRAKYMADVVMPTMRTLFVGHDPGAYKKGFSCATCHGTNATEVGFAMPNGLAPLDPHDMPTPQAADVKTAELASFMITQVTPQMAELLGRPPRDPGGETGFGCFGCHAKEE